MSYIGSTKIGNIYLGSTEIAKAYLGSQLVFQKGGGGGEIWPPATYTRLAALKRNQSSAYFNTGVLVDSATDFDVYWSNNSYYATGGHGIFGIRRLSGGSDTKKVCFYAQANSYFTGYGCVYGTKDPGAITGGGGACKWGGNLIKVSVRGGKWYAWDNFIQDNSAESFTNSDNVPFFLGTPAKNATTIYNTSSFPSCFHEAIFYDSQGNITHRFLPYLDDNSQKGFWDTIAGEFRLVDTQSRWDAISAYTLRSIRVHSRMMAFAGQQSFQSCVEKKGWQLSVRDGQRYFYLTNERYELHSGAMSQSGRTLECSEYNANWHGNGAWWSDTYADPDDYFPLLYVSTDKDSHLLTVYRLAGSDPTTCTISLVQKIYTPEGDSQYGSTLYYHNYYGKAGCNTFVQTAYTKNSYSSNTGDYAGNVLMYRVFNLPALSAGSEVTLLETDALTKGDVGFVSTTSNGGWNGKYLYITFLKELRFWEIDGNGATQLAAHDFYTTTSADYITQAEPEGFSWYEEGGYFVSLWEPQNGNTLDAYADDLKPYAEGVYNNW